MKDWERQQWVGGLLAVHCDVFLNYVTGGVMGGGGGVRLTVVERPLQERRISYFPLFIYLFFLSLLSARQDRGRWTEWKGEEKEKGGQRKSRKDLANSRLKESNEAHRERRAVIGGRCLQRSVLIVLT